MNEKVDNKISEKKIITKQKYLQGLKCNILLWSAINDFAQNSNYERNLNNLNRNNLQSELILEYSKSLFKDYFQIQYAGSIQETYELTLKKLLEFSTLVNPVFLSQNFFTRIDILKKNFDGTYDIYDIKSVIHLKKDHYLGIAFQKYVAELSGIKISNLFVIQVNEQYVLEEFIEPNKFLVIRNITSKIDSIKVEFLNSIESINKVYESKEKPKVFKENSCGNPKLCQLKSCWQTSPEMDIFELREGKDVFEKYYQKGIHYIKDLEDNSEFTHIQRIQIDSVKKNQEFININKLKQFIELIKYPVYYLDFETINPIVPIYKFTKSFLHVPFLYVLYVQNSESEELEKFTYIDDNSIDPRLKILEDLSKIISTNGTILCFNDAFEKRCLFESIKIYKEYSDWYYKIENQFLDLSIPFRNFYYYHPKQKGSASLKSILPALTSMNHKDLEIQDGNAANLEFLRIKMEKVSADEAELIKKRLLEYCSVDSYALYLILNTLKLKCQA